MLLALAKISSGSFGVPGKPDVVLRVYWDSCVFVSWFDGGEGRTQEQMDALSGWVELIDQGQAMIVTSSITYAEVLECRMSASLYRKFERLLLSESVELVGVDWGVVKRAREMRERVLAQKRPGVYSQLSVPDALQLATAALSNVSQFHTYDGAGRKAGLLRLNGRLDDTPHICVPSNPGIGRGRRRESAAATQIEFPIRGSGRGGS